MTHNIDHELLNREMAADDPWRLDGNPFERDRHTQILRLSLAQGRVANALEVGCAAGAFTERLAPICQRLTVIDVVEPAITRARLRLKETPHISWIISDVQQFSSDELFDLIVVAEVLYYVGDLVQIRAAVRNLVGLLAPGGQLVFGSARDANCQRWGHAAGAETTIAMLNESLTEIECIECRGASINEDCLLARFQKPISAS
ncbi:nodulation methyltransferase NodS [Mesorhizobium helmanticense]|uniref:Nodulation protein S n=1 Tax=Mesorhizobium helmanticense TaxID=1776423 RepID=A0A2T4ILJ1_9HYPH|nr:nodulation methyltransferase NodS [Mesorhizobium helmanticense]PTE06473.1 SAM-dependent methyltransferase [Mesorhizobium helmanticense]